MLRVVLTVLMHGMVFMGFWWQQTQDTVAEPSNFSAGMAYWQANMNPMMWGVMAFMLITPVLALLSTPRQSIRGRSLLIINWLFVPIMLYLHYAKAYEHVWMCWLVFSAVMLGIAILNRLSARLARAPKSISKK